MHFRVPTYLHRRRDNAIAQIVETMASKISNELELLRMKGLAKKQKANIFTKDGGGDAFLTPEEAKAFLAGQKEAAKKEKEAAKALAKAAKAADKKKSKK